MKAIGIGVLIFGLALIGLGAIQSPLTEALVRPTDTVQYLAALQNQALTIHAGLALLIVGTIISAGAAIVDTIKRR
ncbi:MAG: hypothetical protein PGN21_06965 [Sphingomonas paucimobilis]